ncbi:mitochondrial matrix iron-sulfur protein [Didymella heteroderae]|uniref:Mitochondrial matrix iron-sulfur protein n=1 Tax=Didymella heteroderae TaxID=1769908 RepID=A0A9P5C0C3_9PLEO|nr:mitochondrial matrix iron-sulfur protein [Didymella heteroderae]
MLLESSQPFGVPEHCTRQEHIGTGVAADIAHCACGSGVAEGLFVESCPPPRAPRQAEARLHVTFIDKDGQSHTFEVSAGDNLLDIAQANDLEMEGACGGSCACSTCHVIVEDEAKYEAMEEPDDDENDMLDLAFGLTETSRLGCQVKMSKELDGLVVKLPSMTRNLQASDFK